MFEEKKFQLKFKLKMSKKDTNANKILKMLFCIKVFFVLYTYVRYFGDKIVGTFQLAGGEALTYTYTLTYLHYLHFNFLVSEQVSDHNFPFYFNLLSIVFLLFAPNVGYQITFCLLCKLEQKFVLTIQLTGKRLGKQSQIHHLVNKNLQNIQIIVQKIFF